MVDPGSARAAEVWYEGRDLEVLADVPNYYAWIMDEFRPYLQGDCCEFGAGTGNVSINIRPHVDTLSLVEPSIGLIDELRSRFAMDAGCRILAKTLEDAMPDLSPASFDCIVMVNVLEHIEDDRAALKDLYDRLRPGGSLLVFVPAMQLLYAPFDRDVGHFRRYHKAPLVDVVGAAGFSVEVAKYFDFIGFFGWFLLMKLMRQSSLDPNAAKMFDRIVVPWSRRIERILTVPFGKNILLCARKPKHSAEKLA